MEEVLRGVWRINLGFFAALGDYEKSLLKDLRGDGGRTQGSMEIDIGSLWRRDFGIKPLPVLLRRWAGVFFLRLAFFFEAGPFHFFLRLAFFF